MLPKKLQEIIDDFSILDTQEEKYEALIEFGQELGSFSDDLKTEKNMIAGCMSEVYIDVEVENNVVHLKGWASSVLVKGLISILVIGLDGLSVDEVLSLTPEFIKETGITSSLTTSRANTPLNVLTTIQSRVKRQIKSN
ncbi:SufE family protein [Candidatus Woesearchaeota archaeon]|nr:SufE family protein [Candidatus Woesearchaeota archaeon]